MKYSNHQKNLNSILHLSPPSTKKVAKRFANDALSPLSATAVLLSSRMVKASGSFQDLSEHLVAVNQYYIVGKKQTTTKKTSPFFMSLYVFVYTLTQIPKCRYL